MAGIYHFAVLGGDLRSAHLAIALAEGGDFVYAAGFDRFEFPTIVRNCNVQEAIERSDAVILPLPVSKDRITLFAPYSNERLILSDEWAELLVHKTVFCGQQLSVPDQAAWQNIRMIDYAAAAEFTVRNAVPTAEGAIQLALAETDRTLCGARCLVAGYGQIGHVLARLLDAFGASVTVSARKSADLADIEMHGWRAVETARIKESGTYDIIFNTIPAPVLDHDTLIHCAPDALIIELASAPYGVDFNEAKRLNIPVIPAPGLPGKTAPRTAGAIIRTVILHYMRMLR